MIVTDASRPPGQPSPFHSRLIPFLQGIWPKEGQIKWPGKVQFNLLLAPFLPFHFTSINSAKNPLSKSHLLVWSLSVPFSFLPIVPFTCASFFFAPIYSPLPFPPPIPIATSLFPQGDLCVFSRRHLLCFSLPHSRLFLKDYSRLDH